MLGKWTDIRDLSDNTKKYNIYVIRVPEREEKLCSAENNTKKIYIYMFENFQDLVRDTNLQIQEAEWLLIKINPKKSMLSHFVIKLLKTKNKRKS